MRIIETEIKLCECGCGQSAPIAKKSYPYRGVVKGQVQRFIRFHAAKVVSDFPPAYKRGRTGEANGMYKHGCRRSSRTYASWSAMLRRCYNPNWHKFAAYGGRGITVCDRWRGEHGFENFLADMGERPAGKTLDRKRVNENYEKDNCRWATQKEQCNNRRSNVLAN